MGHLVLDHSASELVEFLGDFLEVLVVVADGHALGTHHVGIDAGDAEAAFVVLALALALLEHDGIDHDALEAGEVVVDVGHDGAVDDEHALADADLGCGEAAAIGHRQRVLKVIDQLGQLFLAGEVRFLSPGLEHFRAIEIDRLYHSPFDFLSMYPCRMMAALMRSTDALFLRSLYFMPPSIMALWASTDVKRSSSSSTGTPGKAFRRTGRKASTSAAASEGLPSRFMG